MKRRKEPDVWGGGGYIRTRSQGVGEMEIGTGDWQARGEGLGSWEDTEFGWAWRLALSTEDRNWDWEPGGELQLAGKETETRSWGGKGALKASSGVRRGSGKD